MHFKRREPAWFSHGFRMVHAKSQQLPHGTLERNLHVSKCILNSHKNQEARGAMQIQSTQWIKSYQPPILCRWYTPNIFTWKLNHRWWCFYRSPAIGSHVKVRQICCCFIWKLPPKSSQLLPTITIFIVYHDFPKSSAIDRIWHFVDESLSWFSRWKNAIFGASFFAVTWGKSTVCGLRTHPKITSCLLYVPWHAH